MADELTDDEAVHMHRELAAYHNRLAANSILDVLHEYHADLAERLTNEVEQIPLRRAARERAEARYSDKADD